MQKSRHATPAPDTTFRVEEKSSSNRILSNEIPSKMEVAQKLQKNVFQGINMTKGHWDQSRKFKIFHHVFTGSKYETLSHEYNITLATQSSLDKLYWLSEVSKFVCLFCFEWAPSRRKEMGIPLGILTHV